MSISRLRFLCGVTAIAFATTTAAAQENAPFNERTVTPGGHVQDKEDIWSLHFKFKDPRTLSVEIPGRGRKIIWYMWYQLVNQTGQPRTVTALDFEILPRGKNVVLHDEVLLSVQESIRRIEDPTNRLNMKNSVSICREPIPLTKPDSAPRAVTGVAIWPDVYEKSRDVVFFDVYVTGLSNGWSIDDGGTIRRKTLHLVFRRTGDEARGTDEIKYESSEWIYRAVTPGNTGLQPPPSVNPANRPKEGGAAPVEK